jgi:hypothetical protein
MPLPGSCSFHFCSHLVALLLHFPSLLLNSCAYIMSAQMFSAARKLFPGMTWFGLLMAYALTCFAHNTYTMCGASSRRPTCDMLSHWISNVHVLPPCSLLTCLPGCRSCSISWSYRPETSREAFALASFCMQSNVMGYLDHAG